MDGTRAIRKLLLNRPKQCFSRVSQLQPKRIILHCCVHKTGSTYFQRNLQASRDKLLDQGILYFGPQTIKKRCPGLWKYLQWGRSDNKPKTLLRNQILSISTELAGEAALGNIHTILVSFESIFGTLRAGLTTKDRRNPANKENQPGLYRYSRRRVRRLMEAFEVALSTKSIQWSICFANRESDNFIRSCHVQLIKEGHEIASLSHDDFVQNTDFAHAEKNKLIDELSDLQKNRMINIIPFSYDENIDRSDPSVYLNNFIKIIMPELAEQIQPILTSDTDSTNSNKTFNPGISDRGIEIAKEARPIFTKQEWKLFRKFLQRNFTKGI